MELRRLQTEVGKALERLNTYETAICEAEDLISFLDRNARYTAVNQAYADAHGIPTDKIVGKTPRDLHGEEDYQNILPQLEECLRGERVRYQSWFEFPRRGRRFMDVTYLPLIGASGAIESVAVLSRDMTPLREYADWLAERNSALLELCADKDRLFAMVAHDLRSPLVTLQTAMAAIDLGLVDPALIGQAVEDARPALESAAELLDEILGWAEEKLQGFDPAFSQFDLREVVASKVRQLTPFAQAKGVSLVTNGADPIEAHADPKMVSIVLYNLIANAIKFTPASGTVTLTLTADQGTVVVAVRDTGCGMSPADVEGAFKARRIDPKPGARGERGSGLGLFFCRELLAYCHGKIWVESRLGEGSTFTFSLPAQAPSPSTS